MRTLLFALLLTSVSLSAAANEKNNVTKTLDALHQSAADADFTTYFDLYTDDAIFIGTDANEVWAMDEFKKYAKPAFESGKGWTYRSHDRHIYFSKKGDVAWFDELLDHDTYGLSRGTGVLERMNSKWKLTQYHLTFPIPNALAKDLTRKIKQASENNP